jgi:hypothetical protein
LVPPFHSPALLPSFRESQQSCALKRGDVVVEAGGGLSEQRRDFLRGPRLLGEKFHDSEAERVRQRPHLGQSWNA